VAGSNLPALSAVTYTTTSTHNKNFIHYVFYLQAGFEQWPARGGGNDVVVLGGKTFHGRGGFVWVGARSVSADARRQ
jgi:hypothetical protein